MSAPLRIWYVIDAYTGPNAGTEKQLLLLIARLVELGHEVRLFVLRETPYTLSSPNFPCPIEALGVRSLGTLASVRRMLAFRSRVRRERPDVVHTYFNDSAVLVPIFCRPSQTRVFTSRRDMGFWHTPGYLAMLRLANRRVDGIICNSRAVAELTVREEHALPSLTAVIYNGISNFHPVADAATSTSHSTGPDLPSEAHFNICLVANLRPVKRVQDLLHAAKRVVSIAPQARFWIAGETLEAEYERSLRSIVETLSLEHVVRFMGESPDPLGLMRRCQAGVLCSESEGLSNTLLEYMYCGLPSVCSAVGGNPELVEHGVNGFLYPCGNTDQLADELLKLIFNEGLHSHMAKAAIARARELSVEAMADTHLALYQGAQSVN